MSPTIATTKIKGKTKTKTKTKRKSRSARAETNRQNSLRSTGPKSTTGKSRSRFNALKHGMTARSRLLPDEDASELQAQQRAMIDDLQPRNHVESILVGRLADDIWRSDRSESAADRRLSFRLRHEPREQAGMEKKEALKLGERLFWQLAFPLPISARFPL
jgi:hypothetical protein